MANSFGRMLRDARRRAGLTQVELGGVKISGSYVSLIESGRRAPTDEMIEHFASALNIETEKIRQWSRAEDDSRVLDLVLLSSARSGMEGGEFMEVEELAMLTASRALSEGNMTLYWEMSRFRIEAARARHDYPLCRNLSEELLTLDFVAHSDYLRAWALANYSVGLRETGKLEQAVEVSREALHLAQKIAGDRAGEGQLSQRDLNLALLAHAAAASEAGHDQEMLQLCDWLEGEIQKRHAALTREVGDLSWALGNLCFELGREEDGARWHDQAMECFKSIQVSLDMRFRLLRHTVFRRIDAGCTGSATEALVNDLINVLHWLEGDSSSLAHLLRSRWLIAIGRTEEAQQDLEYLRTVSEDMEPGQRAQVLEMVALRLVDLPVLDAVQMLAESARLYADVGDEAAMRRVLELATQGARGTPDAPILES